MPHAYCSIKTMLDMFWCLFHFFLVTEELYPQVIVKIISENKKPILQALIYVAGTSYLPFTEGLYNQLMTK